MPIRRRRLARSVVTPAFVSNVRADAHADPPASLVAPRAPRPACASCDGKVVPSKAEPRRCDADETSEEEIEAEVAEIAEARAAHVDGGADGYEDEDK